MAKDILVTDMLSEQMIKAGAKLVERLDVDKSEVKSAFWLFFQEERLLTLGLKHKTPPLSQSEQEGVG